MLSILIILCALVHHGFAWRVTACHKNYQQGSCVTIQASGCMNSILFDDTYRSDGFINSINTHGGCVRAYSKYDCLGKSRAYYVGSPKWAAPDDLSKTSFNKIILSFGPCLPNECALKGGKLVDNCVFHDQIWVGAGKPDVKTTVVEVNDNPIIKEYQRGPNDRLEFVKARLSKQHLDNGTDTNDEMLEYVRAIGRSNDVVGYVVPKILGGVGTVEYNVFPQNEQVNKGLLYESFERMIYDAVEQQEWLDLEITLIYNENEVTRPSVIIYRMLGPKYYRMRDLINP